MLVGPGAARLLVFIMPEPRTPNPDPLLPDAWPGFARIIALVFGLFFAYTLLVNDGGFNNGKNQ